jgi:hypothetical protein
VLYQEAHARWENPASNLGVGEPPLTAGSASLMQRIPMECCHDEFLLNEFGAWADGRLTRFDKCKQVGLD